MAVREIVFLGDPVLRQEAAPVEVFDDALRELVSDMFETMYHAKGVGLAAPQIGISKRILVIDVYDEDDPESGRLALINPEIVAESEDIDRAGEGCLSIPGLEEIVARPWAVQVRGFDPEGNEVEIEADDLMARALQHEIDHLDGVLFLDRVGPLQRRMLIKKWKKLQSEAEDS